MAPLLPRDDAYSPAVPSPLNPTSAYHIQSKQQHRHKRVRIVGKTNSKQSPTEYLLRHKAAIAFNNQVMANTFRRQQPRSRGGGRDEEDISTQYRRWRSEVASNDGGLGALGIYAVEFPSSDVGPEAEAMGGGGYGTSPAAMAAAASAPHLMPGFYLPDGDDKQPSSGHRGDEYFVDFSGVTIENITTVVLMPQRRDILACTPYRMLWVLGFFSVFAVLFYIRLQALFDKFLIPS